MFCLYRYRFWYFVSRFWYVVLKKHPGWWILYIMRSNEFSYRWLCWNWLCSLHSVHHETPGCNRVITPVIFSGGHPHHVPKPDMLISYQKPPLLQDVSLENLDQSPGNSTQLKRRENHWTSGKFRSLLPEVVVSQGTKGWIFTFFIPCLWAYPWNIGHWATNI